VGPVDLVEEAAALDRRRPAAPPAQATLLRSIVLAVLVLTARAWSGAGGPLLQRTSGAPARQQVTRRAAPRRACCALRPRRGLNGMHGAGAGAHAGVRTRART